MRVMNVQVIALVMHIRLIQVVIEAGVGVETEIKTKIQVSFYIYLLICCNTNIHSKNT